VIPEPDTTVLLYQDGKPVELSPNETGAIYPFSANPQKMGCFWKPRAAKTAEVVCVDRKDVCVRWGTPSLNHIIILDAKTQKPRNGIARGQLQLTVTDARLLYEKLLRNGPKTEEKLQDYLRNVFVNSTKIQLFRIFEKLSGDTAEIPDTLRQTELAEEFYEATKDTFKDYGMEMDERTKHTILLSMTLKTHEATPNPISRGGGFLI
jgi:membrane protease subunit (stomatin/prohibitin family)